MPGENQSTRAEGATPSLFAKHLNQMRKVDNKDEYERYVAEKTVTDATIDACDWWRMHEQEYQDLRHM